MSCLYSRFTLSNLDEALVLEHSSFGLHPQGYSNRVSSLGHLHLVVLDRRVFSPSVSCLWLVWEVPNHSHYLFLPTHHPLTTLIRTRQKGYWICPWIVIVFDSRTGAGLGTERTLLSRHWTRVTYLATATQFVVKAM